MRAWNQSHPKKHEYKLKTEIYDNNKMKNKNTEKIREKIRIYNHDA